MLRLLSFCSLMVWPMFAHGDTPPAGKDIVGYWLGTMKASAIELRVGFKVERNDGKLSATMDSIDQGARNIPIDEVKFEEGTITLGVPKIKMKYVGKLQDDGNTIVGELDQGLKFKLDLKRTDKAPELPRPQTPKPPYPYEVIEVTFPSKAKDVTLAGTLTKPKGDGPFVTAVLVSGSGPQDRDETLFQHKPFMVLADHLTRQGIAVLRYDDRGVGKSTGKFATALSTDFADDAAGAVVFLKARKDVSKVGIIGHSEGGLVGPMVAVQSGEVAFLVLLAGPGQPGDELLADQSRLIAKAMGAGEKELEKNRKLQEVIFPLAKKAVPYEKAKETLDELAKQLTEEERKAVGPDIGYKQLIDPWMVAFLNYDPRPALAKVKCPVLAVNGEKDLQVPAVKNLEIIENTLRSNGNAQVTTKVFAGLNHLFQPCKVGSPNEYGKIDTTFDVAALEVIASWIKGLK